MSVIPTAASDLGLPVFCPADASLDNLSPLWLSSGRSGVELVWRPIRVSVATDQLSLTSYLPFEEPSQYGTKFNSDNGEGDWRLDNFLRAGLEQIDDEDASDWEHRVDQLWTVAGIQTVGGRCWCRSIARATPRTFCSSPGGA